MGILRKVVFKKNCDYMFSTYNICLNSKYKKTIIKLKFRLKQWKIVRQILA